MAVHSMLVLLDTLTFIDYVLRASQGYLIIYQTNHTELNFRHTPTTRHSHLDPIVLEPPNLDFSSDPNYHKNHHTTIHHYARHNLCINFEGKKHLYKAMKTKFCGMTLQFIANYVMTVCNEKGRTLDELVSELFDLDGDGYVSHYEKNLYT